VCTMTDTGYRFASSLPDGTTYCVDSTGASTDAGLGSGVACP
jgi:hypothetical protein